MSEKMTVSLLAVFHGDPDALIEAETVEAGTKEELMALYAGLLEGVAGDIRALLAGDASAGAVR